MEGEQAVAELSGEDGTVGKEECQSEVGGLRRFRAMEFISEWSKQCSELTATADLYSFLAGKLLRLVGKGVVVISSSMGDGSHFRMQSLRWAEEGVKVRFKRNVKLETFEVTEAFRSALLGGKLLKVRRNGSVTPPPSVMQIVSSLEKSYGPQDFYAVGFVWKADLLGMAMAIVPSSRRLKSRAMVETFAGLASAAIRQRQAEVALRESEMKYRQLVKYAPSGVYEVDFQKGKFLSVNDIMCEYTGYTKEEFLSMSAFDLLSKESGKAFAERLRRVSDGEIVPETMEYIIRAKDGRQFWVTLNTRFFWVDGLVKRATVIAHNITDIKETKEALKESETKLHLLSSRLINAQEEERRRISRELHDELGQDLMVLKLQMRSLQRSVGKHDPMMARNLEQIFRYINEIAENVRRLSRNLSPAVLEDLGLVPAIRWVLGESSKLYHFDIAVDVDDMHGLFTSEKEMIIYRIFQEALTNVEKHAQATEINISARVEDGSCILTFEDNGKGFDVQAIRKEGTGKGGFGLTTMRERSRMLGGHLDLWSHKGRGTRIRLDVPLKKGGAG